MNDCEMRHYNWLKEGVTYAAERIDYSVMFVLVIITILNE